MTHLFLDVSPATLSGVIARERMSSSEMSFEELEENVVKKVLWYRDLPSEKDNLPPEVSYDQSSFKYKRSTENEDSESKQEAEVRERKGKVIVEEDEHEDFVNRRTLAFSDNFEVDIALPPPPNPILLTELNLPPNPVVPSQFVTPTNLAFKLPPPPPAIVGWSSFSNSGVLNATEVTSFVLMAALDYIRNRFF